MQIYGPATLHGPQSLKGPHNGHPAPQQPTSKPGMARDELNISDAGRVASETAGLVDSAKNLPEIRQDRVAEIRAQIASGTYETAEKIDGAIERLLDEIG